VSRAPHNMVLGAMDTQPGGGTHRKAPPLASLSPEHKAQVVALLDKLAFDDASAEYWAPGALYRGSHDA
jgi:hypothetical protein